MQQIEYMEGVSEVNVACSKIISIAPYAAVEYKIVCQLYSYTLKQEHH